MPGTHWKHLTTCLAVVTCLVLLGGVLTTTAPSAHASTPSHLRPATNSPAFPYVDSNGQLRDGSGNPIYLRGAMIDSNLAYYNRWPKDVMALVLTPTTFQKMHDVWGMNVVRLDISYWLYEDNPGDGRAMVERIKAIWKPLSGWLTTTASMSYSIFTTMLKQKVPVQLHPLLIACCIKAR